MAKTAHLDPDDHDINMVEHWLKVDLTRWVAGILAGVLAAWIALSFASVLAVVLGREPLFAVKLMATPFLAESAMEYGFHLGPVLCGLAFFSALGGFWGFVFSHFTFTNHVPSLLAMGVVWGLFSWVFIWNLFFHAIKPMHVMNVSSGAAFPVCIVYGISLVSVGFFDRLLRGK